jgi:hypothetical protein
MRGNGLKLYVVVLKFIYFRYGNEGIRLKVWKLLYENLFIVE